MTMKLESSTA